MFILLLGVASIGLAAFLVAEVVLAVWFAGRMRAENPAPSQAPAMSDEPGDADTPSGQV